MDNRPFAPHFGHQPYFQLFQVAQATVDELGGAAGSAGGKILHFQQAHPHSARGGIQGNARASDAAANNQHIQRLAAHLLQE